MADWRRIDEDGVSASFGLAADEATAGRVGEGRAPPTLRLYTYRSHCALVGLFQDVRHEVHLDFCRTEHVAVNRRPTGGGAILMGEDQLGVALCVPGRGPGAAGRPRELMRHFSQGLIDGLAALGIAADFRGKNDLEVRGRKIAGLGIHRHASGGLLFHASVLVGLDVALMTRVLRTPYGEAIDDDLETIAGRTTTVRDELGREVAVDEARDRVGVGFAGAFGVGMVPAVFGAGELDEIGALERRKYRSEEWLWRSSSVPDRLGSAEVATAEGRLEARVALAGRTIKALFLRGDFFAAERSVVDLETRLRWHPAAAEAVTATVEEVWGRAPAEARPESLSPAVLTSVIMDAVGAARAVEDEAAPYGCYVSPGNDREAASGD